MTLETYRKYRAEFLKQYIAFKKEFPKDSILLTKFSIRNFKEFIFLYAKDNPTCTFFNGVSSIEPKKFKVFVTKTPVSRLAEIRDLNFSMFDKFPDELNRVSEYYKNHIRPCQ